MSIIEYEDLLRQTVIQMSENACFPIFSDKPFVREKTTEGFFGQKLSEEFKKPSVSDISKTDGALIFHSPV